jgi:hypothetical protein
MTISGECAQLRASAEQIQDILRDTGIRIHSAPPQSPWFGDFFDDVREIRGCAPARVGGEHGIRTSGTVCLTPRDGLLTVY